MSDTKTVPTLEVASMVTGVCLCTTNIPLMMEIASHLCGFDVWNHELVHGPTMDIAIHEALSQHPLLPLRDAATADWQKARDMAIDSYGAELSLRKGSHSRVESPIATIRAVAPHAEILAITPQVRP